MAVGGWSSTVGQSLFAERWDGSQWSPEVIFRPLWGTEVKLRGVSYTSEEACVAVGRYRNKAGRLDTLAEVWNGIEWVIQPTPVPGGEGQLTGVSCESTLMCVAVGNNHGSPLAEANY
jgi:hypothetical protein